MDLIYGCSVCLGLNEMYVWFLLAYLVQWFCYLRILHLLLISFYFSESQGVSGCNNIADLSLKIVFWTLKFAVGILKTASPRTHKLKIVNGSLPTLIFLSLP